MICRICKEELSEKNCRPNHLRCKKCEYEDLKRRKLMTPKERADEKKSKFVEKWKNYGINEFSTKKEIRAAWWKRYEERHKEELKQKKRARYKLKGLSSQAKIKKNISSRIKHALKSKNLKKDNSSIFYLGCSVEDFKKHLESLWVDGMSWENHGAWKKNGPLKWHVDHILPCDSFDLTKEEDLKKCFHYSNLRPIWANDNILKSNFLYKKDNFPYPRSYFSFPADIKRIPRIIEKINKIIEISSYLEISQIIQKSIEFIIKEKNIQYEIDTFYILDEDLEFGLDRLFESVNFEQAK